MLRVILALLAAVFCIVPPFGLCYHADGGMCVESRARECCAAGAPADAPSGEDCQDCADVLGSVALPTSRPQLSHAAGDGHWLVFPDVARLLRCETVSSLSRARPVGRSRPVALQALPLRC